jgi:hypothetical protein
VYGSATSSCTASPLQRQQQQQQCEAGETFYACSFSDPLGGECTAALQLPCSCSGAEMQFFIKLCCSRLQLEPSTAQLVQRSGLASCNIGTVISPNVTWQIMLGLKCSLWCAAAIQMDNTLPLCFWLLATVASHR